MGRTRDITLSRTTPTPPASATIAAMPSPDGAQTPTENGSHKPYADNSTVLNIKSRESLADKVRDAASTAASSLAQAASAAAHGSSVGGGSMEGRWEQEAFILPFPDADEEASDADGDDDVDEQEGVNVPKLLGPAAKCIVDDDGNATTTGGGSSSVSVDDGVHLRVEVWQGKHCHGQVSGKIKVLYPTLRLKRTAAQAHL